MRTLNSVISPLLFALAVALAAPAAAGTIGGRVTNTDGAGVGGLQVQLWSIVDKTVTLQSSVTTGGTGTYTFTEVRGGTYRVSVRMPPTMENTWTDRWLDMANPTADGWAGLAADELTLTNSDASTGMDITVGRGGGLDGHVLVNGARTAGFSVRVERQSNVTQHHNMLTMRAVAAAGDTPYLGAFFFRGLQPATDYRIMLWDPDARFETKLLGPYTVSGTGVTEVGELEAEPMADDPNEPNNTPLDSGASIPSDIFRGDTPEPFVTFGALVGPRNEDVDYYCFQVQDHDRFIASTSTDLAIAGEFTDHPYTDPVIAFTNGDGSRIISQDDDSGPGFNAALDTGDIPQGGLHCFVVSMQGDTNFRGVGQNSAGRYELTIELGNRVPSVVLTRDGGPLPPPPSRAIVEEGGRFRVDVQISDPDGDPLTVTTSHHDNSGAEVTDGVFEYNEATGTGTYTWNVPDDGARYAPYEIIITADDGEFATQGAVLVDPNEFNLTPPTPLQIAPIANATVESWEAELVIRNAVDPDFDPLSYEFEVYYGDPVGAPDEEGVVPQDLESELDTTSYRTQPIEENARVAWRVRANDFVDDAGASPWSGFETFIVNVENEAPYDFALISPADGATVNNRTPTIVAANTRDPDGDSLSFFFEVANDSDFTDLVTSSGYVPQNTVESETAWEVAPALAWGETYYVRAVAVDPAEASTDYTAVHEFRVKDNQSPRDPEIVGDFGAECAGLVYGEAAPSEFLVAPVIDPEGEEITIDFRIYLYESDLASAEPIYQETRIQPEGHTGDHIFVVPQNLYQENERYLIRVRAEDSERFSDWSECDFRIDAVNSEPSRLAFIEPQLDHVFPSPTNEVRILIENAVDEDDDELDIAWCAINTLNPDDVCPDNHLEWRSVPQHYSGQTEFFLENLFPGAAVSLSACAYDAEGVCGEVATTAFTIESQKTEVTPSLCSCNLTISSANDAKPWMLLWGVVFVAMRRRPRRERA